MPIILAVNLEFYANWAKNDYSLIKDPADYNKKVMKKLKEEEETLEKVKNYQETILNAQNPDIKDLDASHDGSLHDFLNSSTKISKKMSKKMTIQDPKAVARVKQGFIDVEKLRKHVPETIPD